jgi:hypothetical protein
VRKAGTRVGGGWVLMKDVPEPWDATNPYWTRRGATAPDPFAFDALRKAMREIYNNCTQGGVPCPPENILR